MHICYLTLDLNVHWKWLTLSHTRVDEYLRDKPAVMYIYIWIYKRRRRRRKKRNQASEREEKANSLHDANKVN